MLNSFDENLDVRGKNSINHAHNKNIKNKFKLNEVMSDDVF